MPKTSLPNLWKSYWIEKPTEWHRNSVGTYHVSTIGCDNQHLEASSHSGPCLRETFYVYINPKERNLTTEGNFNQGNVMHKEVIRIYVINHPYSIGEFPLGKQITKDIMVTGSIDIVEFLEDNQVDIIDFKSASDWTFPYTEESKNPTHFNQVYIYTYWLQHFVLGIKKIRNLKIVYLNKHDQYTGEQIEKYNNDVGREKFLDYIKRVKYLHACLKGYNEIMEYYKTVKNLASRKNLIKKETQNCIPNPENHHWCKLCSYRHRCRDNVISDEDVIAISLDDIEYKYSQLTGKSPRWRGNYTKAFKSFKGGFKIV